MTDPMDPMELGASYLLGALDDDERAEFEAQLAERQDVRDELEYLAPAVEALASTADTPAPDRLRGAVLGAIATTSQLGDDPEVIPEPDATPGPDSAPAEVVQLDSIRRRHWLPLAAIAAAIVIVAALGTTLLQRDSLSPTEQLAVESDVVITSLQGDGDLEVIWSPSLDEVAVRATGIVDHADGETFQLWFQLADGSIAHAGLFQSSDGEVEHRWPTQDLEAVAWGVTVEPAGGSEEPTGTPVFTGAVSRDG